MIESGFPTPTGRDTGPDCPPKTLGCQAFGIHTALVAMAVGSGRRFMLDHLVGIGRIEKAEWLLARGTACAGCPLATRCVAYLFARLRVEPA